MMGPPNPIGIETRIFGSEAIGSVFRGLGFEFEAFGLWGSMGSVRRVAGCRVIGPQKGT